MWSGESGMEGVRGLWKKDSTYEKNNPPSLAHHSLMLDPAAFRALRLSAL